MRRERKGYGERMKNSEREKGTSVRRNSKENKRKKKIEDE